MKLDNCLSEAMRDIYIRIEDIYLAYCCEPASTKKDRLVTYTLETLKEQAMDLFSMACDQLRYETISKEEHGRCMILHRDICERAAIVLHAVGRPDLLQEMHGDTVHFLENGADS